MITDTLSMVEISVGQGVSTWRYLLYRFYDADAKLLYVGRTGDLNGRFRSHAKHQAWWPEVARATAQSLPDLETLISAERVAIQSEAPRYNIVYNTMAASPCAARGLRDDTRPSIRLAPEVRQVVDLFCIKERRGVSNAVNLLVIEALTARGLWSLTSAADPSKTEAIR